MSDTDTVIGGSDYLAIANAYANIKKSMDLMAGFAYAAVDTVVYLNSVVPTVDLVDTFYSTYQQVQTGSSSPTSLLGAVGALQSHVMKRYKVTDINVYLGDHLGGRKVCTEWQILSGLAGYAIDNVYVQACS